MFAFRSHACFTSCAAAPQEKSAFFPGNLCFFFFWADRVFFRVWLKLGQLTEFPPPS